MKRRIQSKIKIPASKLTLYKMLMPKFMNGFVKSMTLSRA